MTSGMTSATMVFAACRYHPMRVAMRVSLHTSLCIASGQHRAVATVAPTQVASPRAAGAARLRVVSEVLGECARVQAAQAVLGASRHQMLLADAVSAAERRTRTQALAQLAVARPAVVIVANQDVVRAERLATVLFGDTLPPAVSRVVGDVRFTLENIAPPDDASTQLGDAIRCYRARLIPRVLPGTYSPNDPTISNNTIQPPAPTVDVDVRVVDASRASALSGGNDALLRVVLGADITVAIAADTDVVPCATFGDVIELHRAAGKPNLIVVVDCDANRRFGNDSNVLDRVSVFEDAVIRGSVGVAARDVVVGGQPRGSARLRRGSVFAVDLGTSSPVSDDLLSRVASRVTSDVITDAVRIQVESAVFLIDRALASASATLDNATRRSRLAAQTGPPLGGRLAATDGYDITVDPDVLVARAKMLAAHSEAAARRLSRAFAARELCVLRDAAAYAGSALDNALRAVSAPALLVRADSLASDVDALVAAHGGDLADAEALMAYATGRLNEAVYMQFQVIRDFMLELAAVERLRRGDKSLENSNVVIDQKTTSDDNSQMNGRDDRDAEIAAAIARLDAAAAHELAPDTLRAIVRRRASTRPFVGTDVERAATTAVWRQFAWQFTVVASAACALHFGVPIVGVCVGTGLLSGIGFVALRTRWNRVATRARLRASRWADATVRDVAAQHEAAVVAAATALRAAAADAIALAAAGGDAAKAREALETGVRSVAARAATLVGTT